MFSYKPLMRQLLERDMNKKMLKEASGLSTVTMAKFRKNEPVSMETLDSLCNYFDCEIEDIIKHIKDWLEKGVCKTILLNYY